MKTALCILPLALAACVESTRYGDYSHAGTVTYGSGQVVRQSGYAQWRETAHVPLPVSLHYQNGANSVHVHSLPPAQPHTVHVYPAYPQPAPATPYIRSENTLLPACTQVRTVRYGGQADIIRYPCY